MTNEIKDTTNKCDFWTNLEREDKGYLSYRDYETFDQETQKMLDLYTNYIPDQNMDMSTGDLVKGTIVSISTKEIALDIKGKDYVYIDVKPSETRLLAEYSIGDEVEAMVVTSKTQPYETRASISALVKINAYKELDEAYYEKTPVTTFVKERIPAGFMLEINIHGVAIEAFMPNTLAGSNRLTEAQSEALVKTEIDVLLESVQKEKGVYVVSRKKYLKSMIPVEISKIKAQPRDTKYTGIVTGTTPFGIFVEFNQCLTSMIHIVNLEEDVKVNIGNIMPGTEIEFYVRDITTNAKGNRIISSQTLKESLWDTIEEGQVLEATARSIKNYGVLVELSEDALGLIYKNNVEKYNKQISQGDKLKVKVITLNKEDRKIYLDIV